MRDLAILVPSRGRPESVARLREACAATCETDYALFWAFDDDDPSLERNKQAAGADSLPGGPGYIFTGPRKGLGEWTNEMWRDARGEFTYYASIGDDHVPVTPGWDKQLCGVLEDNGGGFAYCWNGQKQEIPNYPEMCVISAPVLDALGWMCEPSMAHYCVDVVWMDLGNAAGCLHYLPNVTLEHRHWMFHKGARDDTYWEAAERGRADVQAHETWRAERMPADVAKVQAALAAIRGGEPWTESGAGGHGQG